MSEFLTNPDTSSKIEIKQIISPGAEVTVHRNGKDGAPDYLEAGWTVVESNDEEGTVVVQSSDQNMLKKYNKDTLLGYQPTDSETDVNQKGRYGNAPQPVAGRYGTPPVAIDSESGRARISSPERSEQLREQASGDLGREAVASVVEGPRETTAEAEPTIPEQMTALTEHLTDKDRLDLRSYAEASDSVREAQKDGRGEDSTYWQQIKGQTLRDMTPDAEGALRQYVSLFNRWTD